MSRITLGKTVRKGLIENGWEGSPGVGVSLVSTTTRTLAICIRGRHQHGREEKRFTTHVEKIDGTI